MRIEPNLRIFATGKTQSGKSHLAKRIIQPAANRIIYDIKREYTGFGAVVHNFSRFEQAVRAGVSRIVYQPEDLGLDEFNRVCWYVCRRLKNILFVVDEVHNFCTKSSIPDGLKYLITVCQGEPYNIGFFGISQRPANVHNDILSNASVWFVFSLNLDRDAKAVEDNTGMPIEVIKALPYRHFCIFNDRASPSISRHQPLSG